MSSSEDFPYVQHNNKNDLEASGSDSNVDPNEDEKELSSDSDTMIENASILDTVHLPSLFLYLYFLLLVPNLNQYSFKKKSYLS